MTTFDERERAFENRYVHDEDLKFRVLARRNHKLGLWAARRLGRDGAAAEEDAQVFVAFAVSGEGDPAVIARVMQDFERGGVPMSREEVALQLATFMSEAQREIMAA